LDRLIDLLSGEDVSLYHLLSSYSTERAVTRDNGSERNTSAFEPNHPEQEEKREKETHHPHHPHHQHHPTPSPDETCRPRLLLIVVVVVETDSIDWSVENVENCGNYEIEHVDALGGGGSFDYGSLVDLGRGPLLLSASYSLTRSTLKTDIGEHRSGVQLGFASLTQD
jgi:hypothetical protein